MLAEDYIVKLLDELVKMMIKMIFSTEDLEPENFIKDDKSREMYESYIALADTGNINEAENLIYKDRDTENEELLKASLLFYKRINKYSDEELQKMNYSREEIKDGIDSALQDYGYNGFEGVEIMDKLFNQ